MEQDKLNRELERDTSEYKERAIVTNLKMFAEQLDGNEIRMACQVVRETLRTYIVTSFERNNRISGPNNTQCQDHYQKLFKQRLTQNATVLNASHVTNQFELLL